MEKTYSFKNTQTLADSKNLFAYMIDECKNQFNGENDFYAIFVKRVNELEQAESSDLYIFPSYAHCCNILNKYEFVPNVSVDVYAVTKKLRTHIKYTSFDENGFWSIPQTTPKEHGDIDTYVIVLKAWNTTVHVDNF